MNATIVSLSHEGRGITHINDKTTFLENALPHEEVEFVNVKKHNKYDTGVATKIIQPSPFRVNPPCQYFNFCGGCVLQHLSHEQQIIFKTKVVEEQLKHIGGFNSINFLTPIIGPILGYRHKARLSVKYVQKKQKLLIGFHEKNSSYVTEIDECKILHPSVGSKIAFLRELIANLSIKEFIPQIEIAITNEVTALVIRHLQGFSEQDIELITNFGQKHSFHFYSQSGGIDTIQPINHSITNLSYGLAGYQIFFGPTDFTQINPYINTQLVERVLSLLDLKPTETVLDLFCGIGNFTLPISSNCMKVFGIEGSKNAVVSANKNLLYNKIKNVEFYVADLNQEISHLHWAKTPYDKILLDPPRTGAEKLCNEIHRFGAKKIVYVSCNPATFARDVKIIATSGYQLLNVTLADMYPHTSHIEIVGCFEKHAG